MTPDSIDSPDRRDGADRRPSPPIDRRTFLRSGCAGVAAGGLGAALRVEADEPAGSDDRRMIVRTERPVNLESASASFDSWLTPADELFVRSHHGAPAVDAGPWRLVVEGLVERPLDLRLEDFGGFEPATRQAVIQCAGNGRALFRPRMPGIPWERGAVGHAEWSGVGLGDLLKKAGLKPGAAHVHLIGGDVPPSPKAPAFLRSVPIEEAVEAGALVAIRMNGAPLPVLHGGPARLVVPGWAANNWTKWLRRLVVSAEESPAFFMKTGYRLPRIATPPGVAPDPKDLLPVTWMNVKSLIARPGPGETVRGRSQEVRGVAWTGKGHVTKVEFSTDREPAWRPAELMGEPVQGSWRRFRVAWTPPGPGPYVLRVRATDSGGNVQPERPPWNKSGYLWNGYDQVACLVS
jgi:DMSO/TMAO reductase YedYZ molybdopterin-dependent catalytic subunit